MPFLQYIDYCLQLIDSTFVLSALPMQIQHLLLEFVGRLLRFLNLPYRNGNEDSIEEYEFHEVFNTLVESRLVRKGLDVEIELGAAIDHAPIQVDLEGVGALAASADEAVHKLEAMGEDSFEHVVEGPREDFEADQQHFNQGEHLKRWESLIDYIILLIQLE